jgi:NADH-quinone oxidoreductase subunit L
MEFSSPFPLIPWSVFIPLIGLGINLFFGRYLGEKVSGWLASLAAGLSFALSAWIAIALAANPAPLVATLAPWFSIGTFQVQWAFRIDTLSVLMMLVVTGVGTLIHVYSIGYMHDDVRHNDDPGRYSRFFVYLNLFIAAMLVLVTANNYLMLFVGWEGVGLCSYLLIGFWYEKGAEGLGNARAAKKAFLVNRIGDFGLLIALFLLFGAFGSLDFDTIFGQASQASQTLVLAVTLFMLLAVAGKSAQLPLYVWLPDAMAGPTPVSALIHAATMVTAGVYLIARSQALFVAAPLAGQVTAWLGALTALFAATIAMGQSDIKKVLAYSTISQLGFMVAAVGMGAVVAGMFHLATHAFFKALLFLGAGSVILGMERGHETQPTEGHADSFDPQDMRNMGGLFRRMPVTATVYCIAALSLAGIVPLAGFYSKDEILSFAAQGNLAIFVVLAIAAFLTAFYIGRQVLMVFFGSPRSEAAANTSESGSLILVPLIILAALTLLGGEINFPGSVPLEHWLAHTLVQVQTVDFNLGVAALSTLLALAGIGSAWLMYGRKPVLAPQERDPLDANLHWLFLGMQHKWWVDEIYGFLIVKPYIWSAGFLARYFDQGLIDGIVNGVGKANLWLASVWRKLQNGYVRSYALVFLTGVAAIVLFIVLR